MHIWTNVRCFFIIWPTGTYVTFDGNSCFIYLFVFYNFVCKRVVCLFFGAAILKSTNACHSYWADTNHKHFSSVTLTLTVKLSCYPHIISTCLANFKFQSSRSNCQWYLADINYGHSLAVTLTFGSRGFYMAHHLNLVNRSANSSMHVRAIHHTWPHSCWEDTKFEHFWSFTLTVKNLSFVCDTSPPNH